MGHDTQLDRRRKDDGPSTRLVLEVPLNGNLDQVLRLFIKALGNGGTNNAQLDAIVEMLRSLASLPANLALVKEELSVIHGLVQELVTNPEQLQRLTEQLKSSTDALDAAVKANQPK